MGQETNAQIIDIGRKLNVD
uniref:Uncharacterized protein n=1 Tax=Rhizophora mucronata TaxID=61149 RepID=A0A2P2R081_RHIMU